MSSSSKTTAQKPRRATVDNGLSKVHSNSYMITEILRFHILQPSKQSQETSTKLQPQRTQKITTAEPSVVVVSRSPSPSSAVVNNMTTDEENEPFVVC